MSGHVVDLLAAREGRAAARDAAQHEAEQTLAACWADPAIARWYVVVQQPCRERFYIGSYADGECARLVALHAGRELRAAGVAVAAITRTAAGMRGERVVHPEYAADVLRLVAEGLS